MDLSAEAARAGAEQRGAQRHRERRDRADANVFDLLRDLHAKGERFDTVILDPPAFAKSKDAVEKARRGYKEINLRALQLLEPGRLPDHLLLLVPRPRGRPRGDPGRRGRRRRRHRHGRREAPTGPRPPGGPGRSRDVLPEVLRAAEAGRDRVRRLGDPLEQDRRQVALAGVRQHREQHRARRGLLGDLRPRPRTSRPTRCRRRSLPSGPGRGRRRGPRCRSPGRPRRRSSG